MKKRLFKVISLSLLLAAILVGYYFLNRHFHIGIPCIVYSTTGFYCPGCGVTRMLFSLLSLKIKDAFMYNQLMFILLPFIVIYYFYYMYSYVTGKKADLLNKLPKGIWVVLLVSVFVFGIMRNLPWFPFLRP